MIDVPPPRVDEDVEQVFEDDDDDSLRSDISAHDSMPELEDSSFEGGLLPPLDVIEGYFQRDEPEEDNNKKDDSTDESECKQQQQPSFAPFSRLHEDLQMKILSFVATIPFEDPTNTTRPSVIHVLPYVSRGFKDLARSNGLWKPAMERLLAKDPDLWIKGLKNLHSSLKEENDPSLMLHSVHQALSEPGFYEMLRMVVEQHVEVEGPILLCSSSHRVQIETTFEMSFYEPRDRRLIQNVMEGFPEEARQGGVVLNEQGKSPTLLLYAHLLRRAYLAEIRRCIFHDGGFHGRGFHGRGWARVELEPIACVRICRLWNNQEEGLNHARCFRLSSPEIQELKQREHRSVSALGNIVSRLRMLSYEVHLVPFVLENEQGADQEQQQQVRD